MDILDAGKTLIPKPGAATRTRKETSRIELMFVLVTNSTYFDITTQTKLNEGDDTTFGVASCHQVSSVRRPPGVSEAWTENAKSGIYVKNAVAPLMCK